MINTKLCDPGRLPSEEQLLMLKAALLSGPQACEARMAWLADADIDRLGKAARRLLPLLYDRFRSEGVEHPLLPILKGVKRHTWYNNRLLFHHVSQVIKALNEAGIKVMAIKGAALTVEYYRDYSLRPMEDADLLVPLQDAMAAMAILEGLGWIPEQPAEQHEFREQALLYSHALHFTHPSGQDLDLHWHLFPYCVGTDADKDFWAAAREVTFDAQTVRTLDPADQLLHICVHGAAWDITAPIRWIPDALAILRKAPHLSWDRLVIQARNRRLTLMLHSALTYINDNFDAAVPTNVLSDLKEAEVAMLEKLEYRQLLKPCTGFLGTFPRTLYAYARISQGKTFRKALSSFPEYLCVRWKVTRFRQLPPAFCRRASRKISAALSRKAIICSRVE